MLCELGRRPGGTDRDPPPRRRPRHSHRIELRARRRPYRRARRREHLSGQGPSRRPGAADRPRRPRAGVRARRRSRGRGARGGGGAVARRALDRGADRATDSGQRSDRDARDPDSRARAPARAARPHRATDGDQREPQRRASAARSDRHREASRRRRRRRHRRRNAARWASVDPGTMGRRRLSGAARGTIPTRSTAVNAQPTHLEATGDEPPSSRSSLCS